MEKNIIKGAIFDMDGLMLDTEKLLVRFWREAAAQFGYDMSFEDVLGIRSLSRKYAIPRLKGIFGEQFEFEEIRAERIKRMNTYIDKHGFDIKFGLFELLDHLKAIGCSIAVATATDLERATMYLKKADVFHYFDKIICGNMVTNGKPEPDIYLKAAEELELLPSQCAALEDSPNGIKSAYSAGCKVIMIPDLSMPDEEVLPMLSGAYDCLADATDFFKGA